MQSYDADTAECLIFTFKEGLLSPVAHDLRLRVTRFTVTVDEERAQVLASFDAASLVVDAPMKDGVDNPGALSEPDRQKIAAQIREQVLDVRRFPEVGFRSSTLALRADGGYDFSGDLRLHGASRPVSGATQRSAGRQVLELVLHQPDFGITPFRALLGTLKIQADVRVRLTL